jgi:hypothetical protein
MVRACPDSDVVRGAVGHLLVTESKQAAGEGAAKGSVVAEPGLFSGYRELRFDGTTVAVPVAGRGWFEEALGVLNELVSRHRAAILSDWFEHIVGAYPDETARFLRNKREPFGNPVGAALREELGTVLDGAVGGASEAELQASLDRIIRIRAVQEFAPSVAVGFVFKLKPILHHLAAETEASSPELDLRIDQSVDRVAMMAFDIYTTCREQISEIRIRSIRDLSAKQIERLNEWRAHRDREPATVDDDST